MREDIRKGHKLALAQIAAGQPSSNTDIPSGTPLRISRPAHGCHTHNVRTNLSGEVEYTYAPDVRSLSPVPPETFKGYRRADGRAGVRNELWIIPTVGCVNDCAKALAAENQSLVSGSIDGLYAFPILRLFPDRSRPCQTRRLLAAGAPIPMQAACWYCHWGAKNLTHEQFAEELGPMTPRGWKFLTCQDVEEDEMEAGGALLAELAAHAGQARREAVPFVSLWWA